MFDKLIPWKKSQGHGDLKVRQDEDLAMSRFRDEFNGVWDRFWDEWRNGLMEWSRGNLLHPVDLEEEENELVLRAELPGFEAEDLDIKVSGNILTVRAEHQDEGNGKNGVQYRRYGSFYESFPLPTGIEADKIGARYHSGVLEIHLPKTAEYETKRIPVTAA